MKETGSQSLQHFPSTLLPPDDAEGRLDVNSNCFCFAAPCQALNLKHSHSPRRSACPPQTSVAALCSENSVPLKDAMALYLPRTPLLNDLQPCHQGMAVQLALRIGADSPLKSEESPPDGPAAPLQCKGSFTCSTAIEVHGRAVDGTRTRDQNKQ